MSERYISPYEIKQSLYALVGSTIITAIIGVMREEGFWPKEETH
ncbi:MAG TPA: hypothetical protein VK338_05540 [Candidatus Nitrosocosmicus sp.]|nr:hypothetical protein [Candidatus Nitrosocosmicus sp.]